MLKFHSRHLLAVRHPGEEGWGDEKDKFMHFFGLRPGRCRSLLWRSFLGTLSPALMFCVKRMCSFQKWDPSWQLCLVGLLFSKTPSIWRKREKVERSLLWRHRWEGQGSCGRECWREERSWDDEGAEDAGAGSRDGRAPSDERSGPRRGRLLGFHSSQWLLISDVARGGILLFSWVFIYVFGCAGTWDLQSWLQHLGSTVVAWALLVQLVGSSSLTAGWTRAPALGVWSLIHWTTREVPRGGHSFLNFPSRHFGRMQISIIFISVPGICPSSLPVEKAGCLDELNVQGQPRCFWQGNRCISFVLD